MTATPIIAPWSSSTSHAQIEAPGAIQEVALASIVPDIEWLELKRKAESMLSQDWDRIVHQSFQSFSAPASKVTFDFSGRRGYVLLVGHEPEPTTDFDDAPFRHRRRWVTTTGVTSLLLSAGLAIAYAGKGEFYAGMASWVLLGALLLFSVGLTMAVAGWRRRASSQGTPNPSAPGDRSGQSIAATGLVSVLLVLALVHPSATAAIESIDAGDLATADQHLRALANSGEQGPELDLATTKLALAKAKGMGNREAVQSLTDALQKVKDGSAIAMERTRLRHEWIALATTDGRVDDADAEIAALRSELPRDTDLAELSTKVFERRLHLTNERLTEGKHAAALSLLKTANHDDPRVRELALAAYTAKSNACPPTNLECVVPSLRAAAKLEPNGAAAVQLAELQGREIASANAHVVKKGALDARFASHEQAVQRLEQILNLFGTGSEIEEALALHRAALADLLVGVIVLGNSPMIAKHLLANAGVSFVVGDSLITVVSFPGADDVKVYLPVQVDPKSKAARVVGAHIAYKTHGTRDLTPEVVQTVTRVLLGAEIPERSLKGPAKGIKHTATTLARQRISLGWHDGKLVEVIIGSVEP